MSLRIINSNTEQTMSIYGIELKYLSGRLCSCVRENNGYPKKDCGCNLGYWYAPEETIHGIRQNVSQKYLNSAYGRIFDGGAQFTIPKYFQSQEQKAWTLLSHGDIIIVENKFRRETDILRKGIRDRLYAFDVKEILSISQQEKVYKPGIDYNFNGVQIEWIGEQPADGTYYTVEFTCKLQFKVWDNGVKDRGTDAEELPRFVLTVLRRYVDTDDTNPLDSFNLNQPIF